MSRQDEDFAAVVAERVGVPRAQAEHALRRHPVATKLLAALAVPSVPRTLSHVDAEVDLLSPEQRVEAVRAAVAELGTPSWDRFLAGERPAGPHLCWVERQPHGGRMVACWPAEKTVRRWLFGGPDTVLASAPPGWTIQVVPATRHPGTYEVVFTAPADTEEP